MRELSPLRDMIALIRIQPKVSWRTYMLCIMDVCIYAITAFWWLLTSIIYALLPITSAKPTLYWNQAYLTGWLFFLGIAIFVTRIMSKAIKELRGLLALSRTHSSRSPKFSWNQFLRISLPHWLYAEEVLHDPSPTSVLDRVQRSEITVEELGQIYQDMVEPAQSHSSMSFLITLSHDVKISIVGQSGKMESITIQTKSQASMIAFLATRGEGRGAWVLKDEILKHVYGKTGKDQQQAHLNTDTYRINQKIQEAVEKAEAIHGISLISSIKGIDVFEQERFEGKQHWRLSPTCEIDECNILTTLHRRVQVVKEGNVTVLSRDELRPACHHLMETIGQGFLAECQEDNGENQISKEIWPWAAERYVTHRNQCLDILEYAAQQELATARSASSKEEYRNALQWAAKLSSWMVHVAIGIIPEGIKAEEALCKCLKLYKKLVAPQEAKTIFQQYKERMEELSSTWQPSTQVVNSWSEIVEYEMSKE